MALMRQCTCTESSWCGHFRWSAAAFGGLLLHLYPDLVRFIVLLAGQAPSPNVPTHRYMVSPPQGVARLRATQMTWLGSWRELLLSHDSGAG